MIQFMDTIEFKSNIRQFTGTENYYRITQRHLLTDGTKYLADQAKCYWLMDAIASHLSRHHNDDFAVITLTVKNTKALLTLEDGNGNVFARQKISYTDFPLDELKLYAAFDGMHWVIMLTSEY